MPPHTHPRTPCHRTRILAPHATAHASSSRFEPDGLARVVMVEDVGSKLVPTERPNLVLVPCWTGAMDHVVPALVRGLIEVSRAPDLRAHTAMLSNLVGRLEITQPATSTPKHDR